MIERELFDKEMVNKRLTWIMLSKDIDVLMLAKRIGIEDRTLERAMNINDESIPFRKTRERIESYIKKHYRGS